MSKPPTRTGRRRLRAEERRELILEAAKREFAGKGYQEASMVEIARAAGITAAVIYDHFASKAELQITLLESQTEELLTFVGAAVASAPPEPALRMRAGVGAFFTFVEEHAYAWRMLFRDPPSDPAILATYRSIHQRATEGIAIFIKTNASGTMLANESDQVIEMFAQLLKMAQNGLAAWWYEHREVPREEIVDRVLDFCWIGLERVSRGERA